MSTQTITPAVLEKIYKRIEKRDRQEQTYNEHFKRNPNESLSEIFQCSHRHMMSIHLRENTTLINYDVFVDSKDDKQKLEQQLKNLKAVQTMERFLDWDDSKISTEKALAPKTSGGGYFRSINEWRIVRPGVKITVTVFADND